MNPMDLIHDVVLVFLSCLATSCIVAAEGEAEDDEEVLGNCA